MTPEQKFTAALIRPFQTIEATAMQIIVGRRAAVAVGVTLTLLGKLVGQRLRVPDDDTFRRYVKAKIAVNRSNMTIEDILTVATLVVGDSGVTFTGINHGTGAFTLRVEGAITVEIADVLTQLLQRAAGVGIRCILQYTTGVRFKFDVGPGFDVGSLDIGVG